MALQLHVAYASRIMGVGIIAGGPFRCAAGRYPASWWDYTGLYAATRVCTHIAAGIRRNNTRPDLTFSLAETRRLAVAGYIDAPTHLRHDRVWLFSGKNDHTVPRITMDAVYDYYGSFMLEQQVHYIRHPKAGHALITDHYGNRCHANHSPYINNCDFDMAGDLLQHIYGQLQPRVAANPASLHVVDQRPFFDESDASVSLHEQGHVYIPESCLDGQPCRLHIVLHGCQQNSDFIGDVFYTHGGYNEWAEANRIVILYPQVKAWKGRLFMNVLRNPKACWDWWGYSGEHYADQRGKQMQAIMAMVDSLLNTTAYTRALEAL